MEFSPEQLLILSVVASILTVVLRFVYEMFTKAQINVPQWVWLVIVYAVAQGISFLWFPQVFPSWPVFTGDPSADLVILTGFLMEFVTAVSALLGFAKFVYDWLIIKVKIPVFKLITYKR